MIGKLLKWTIRIACALVGLTAILLVVAFFVVNSASFQKKMLQKATDLLEDKLQTHIQIDSVSIDLLTLDAELYRLSIEDRQQRKMFQMDYLKADVDIWKLLNHKLRISEAKVKGLQAELHHVPHDSIDSIANYQFVIDAFKKDKTGEKEVKGEKRRSGRMLRPSGIVLDCLLKGITSDPGCRGLPYTRGQWRESSRHSPWQRGCSCQDMNLRSLYAV